MEMDIDSYVAVSLSWGSFKEGLLGLLSRGLGLHKASFELITRATDLAVFRNCGPFLWMSV